MPVNRPIDDANGGALADFVSLSAGDGRLIDGPAQMINVTVGDCGSGHLIRAADYADTLPAVRCPTCGAEIVASPVPSIGQICSGGTDPPATVHSPRGYR